MSKDTNNSNVEWMYQGPQSLVNREDYLTGRKIDKNFELYNSDFQEKPTPIDHLIAKTTKRTSSDDAHAAKTSILLDLETIKKEDPLVAIKVKEEKIRREILENPLKMKRLQAIVMSAMEKKMKKFARRNSSTSSSSPKKKRKSRDQSSSSSSSSSDDDVDERRRKNSNHRFQSPRRRSNASRERYDGSSRNRRRESYETEKRSETRHNSRKGRKDSRIESPRNDKRSKKRHASNSTSDDHKSASTSKTPAIPGYGLVYLNPNSKPLNRTVRKSRSPVKKSPPPLAEKRQEQKSKRKLTEEEKEQKRHEMLSNAKWREEQRHKNMQTYKKRDEEEEKQNADRSKPADFIRPMLSAVVDESSVQERIKSKKHSIQRRHNAMDTNFARK